MSMDKSPDKVARRGSAFDTVKSPHESTWQRAVIVDVHMDVYACDVRTERGEFIGGIAWPRVAADPAGASGDIHVPRRGQVVALHRELSEPQISFSIPQIQIDPPAGEHKVSHGTPGVGGADGVYAATGRHNYRGGLPADLLPGDWLHVGSRGNMVGVLEGGVALLKATELAKVVVNPVGDLLQLLGRNTDLYTDFGNIEFRNEDGRVSLSLRGGSQQTTESATATEKFTIRADLGHKGELIDVRVTDQQGRTLAQTHWHPDGAVDRYADKDLTETVGGSYTLTTGDQFETVTGNSTNQTSGNVSTQAGGSVSHHADGNTENSAGRDNLLMALRDLSAVAGRNMSQTASGDVTNLPGAAAFKTVVTNGSYVVDVGNPAAGDSQTAQSGYKVSAFNGPVSLESKLAEVALKSGAAKFTAQGATGVDLTSLLGMNLQASTYVNVDSAGLHVGAATDNFIKGLTYRINEIALHTKLVAGLTALLAQLTAAGAAITAAAVPMVIPIIGPILAAPLLAPAGVALTTTSASIGNLIAAIAAFEANATSYLSLKNLSD